MQREQRQGGFTLTEILIASMILLTMVGGIYALFSTGLDTYQVGTSNAEVDRRTVQVLELIADDLATAGRSVVFPTPTYPATTPSVTLQKNTGFAGGAITWGPTTVIAFRHAADDPDDGKDNNGNGLIDEGEVIRTIDAGTPNERTTVITRFVREYLEGEIPNGIDDNGNGLVDEPGLSFDTIGDVWTIRLTLEKRDTRGRLVTQTVQTAVKMRN